MESTEPKDVTVAKLTRDDVLEITKNLQESDLKGLDKMEFAEKLIKERTIIVGVYGSDIN